MVDRPQSHFLRMIRLIQVETEPEILLAYRARLVIIVHKISTATVHCSRVLKDCSNFEVTVQIHANAYAYDSIALSICAMFTGAF
jgi:hypothetical protein